MKTHSCPSFLALTSLLSFFLSGAASSSERWATLSGLGDKIQIEDGETALVVFVPGSQVKLTYQKAGGPEVDLDLDGTNRGSINGNRGQVSGPTPLPLTGPATVTLNNTTVVGLKVVPTETPQASAQPASASAVPSNAVVIPSDVAGPVQVLLETSADLVTWQSAEPGTYGAASTNRFFRVRALIP